MTEEKLKYKLEQLSDSERKLLTIKIKNFIEKETNGFNPDKQKKIVAYLEVDGALDTAGLKTHLKNKLPDYMMPASFLAIEKTPLLPNGKVDKRELLKTKINGAKEKNTVSVEEPVTEIEEKLVKIWEHVLAFSPISTQDNFFEIGGDSILSIQIIAKARKLGIQLTANQLFEHQTISELGKHFSKSQTKVEKKKLKYLVPLREEGAKKPLFCIHSGGGHVVFYNLLAKYMKPNRPIYALEPSGLYGGGDTMHKNIEDMAMDYMNEIRSVQTEGPYNILVYCFSVTVGNEMAIQFTKLGHKANIIVMDTMASPWTLNTPLRLKARIKSFIIRFLKSPIVSIKHYFEDRLWRIKPIIAKYFGNENTRDLENLQKNLRQICLAYEFKPNQGDISLILTEKPHQSLQKVIIDSWEKITNGNLKLSYTKGNHRTLFKEPDIAFVSKKIEDALVE
ncbi:phosphopantetheine-binding protein [Hwangdonia sp.]|uniref:thioesterase domain-containing protein n=1 Tax=Hwangdonia sp. TaxID=1883432 RepID=UPI003AB502E1